MAIRTRILTIFAAAALAACTAPTAATSRGGAPMKAAAVASGSIAAESSAAAPPALGDGCTFSLGTTACVSTAQHEETSTHIEFSGCLYGPNGQPGSRQRTFSDTYLVT